MVDSIKRKIDEGLKKSLEDSTEYELRLYLEDPSYPPSDKEHAGELLLAMHKEVPLQKQTVRSIIKHCHVEKTAHAARELLVLMLVGSDEEDEHA